MVALNPNCLDSLQNVTSNNTNRLQLPAGKFNLKKNYYLIIQRHGVCIFRNIYMKHFKLVS